MSGEVIKNNDGDVEQGNHIPKSSSSIAAVHDSSHSSTTTSPIVTISFAPPGHLDIEQALTDDAPATTNNAKEQSFPHWLGISDRSADVCRICHCGPHTLATPTPQILTPICSPKHLHLGSSSSPGAPSTSTHLQNKPVSPCYGPSSSSSSSPNPITESPDYNLISPCVCSGSLKYVHQCCLQHWIRASNNTSCELCKHPYTLRSTFKPIWKWESLPMSPGEKKRVVCSALFHAVALACVVWSLYVLIDRTVEELAQTDLEWQFWTKIIVEAIGCVGAGILTYVWGKSYVNLFLKWVTFNRSFVVLGKEHRTSVSSEPPQQYPQPVSQQQETDELQQPELIQLIKR